MNVYVYVGNNPINHMDPQGLFIFRAIAGAVIGAAVNAAYQGIMIGLDPENNSWDWGNFAGSAAGGFVIGATGNIEMGWKMKAAVGAVGGLVNTAVDAKLSAHLGEKGPDLSNALGNMAGGGAGNAAAGWVAGVAGEAIGGGVAVLDDFYDAVFANVNPEGTVYAMEPETPRAAPEQMSRSGGASPQPSPIKQSAPARSAASRPRATAAPRAPTGDRGRGIVGSRSGILDPLPGGVWGNTKEIAWRVPAVPLALGALAVRSGSDLVDWISGPEEDDD
jgi:hypothetical protein